MAFPKEDMLYDGEHVHWYGIGKYNATSGMLNFQSASDQTKSDKGPIPEGRYSMYLIFAGTAKVTNADKGYLDNKQGISDLTDMSGPGGKVYNSSDWGKHRVRLNALYIENPKARHRYGFYMHDSTKGYTHGCIEVDMNFFTRLYSFAKAEGSNKKGRKTLHLKVDYPSNRSNTYGDTYIPPDAGS